MAPDRLAACSILNGMSFTPNEPSPILLTDLIAVETDGTTVWLSLGPNRISLDIDAAPTLSATLLAMWCDHRGDEWETPEGY